MKINKYILGAGALLCMMLPAASAQAQDVKLKCMEWNIKSFEYDDNSNAVYFEIAEAMEKIKAENPDIVCFNEFRPDCVLIVLCLLQLNLLVGSKRVSD